MRPRHLVVAVVLASTGCLSSEHPDAIEGGVDPGHDAVEWNPCGSEPQQGCPCAEAGVAVECTAQRRSGDYVSCEPGTRACGENGAWGACVGASAWDGGTE